MASQPMADRNQRGPCFGSSEIADLAAAQYPPLAQPGATQMGEISRTPTDAISPAFLAEAISGRNLSDDIATAAAWNLGESLFHAWQDKVAGALATAYVLYLHLLNGGDQVLGAVLNHPQFPKRRRTHTKNRALIALQLVAKPSDDAHFKAASEYAAFLQCAASQQIQPEEFPERMSKVSLTECKAFVRGCRTRTRIATEADDPPLTTPDDQSKTEEATAKKPIAPALPAVSAVPTIMTAAVEEIPAASVPQSLPKFQMTITVTGEGGGQRASNRS